MTQAGLMTLVPGSNYIEFTSDGTPNMTRVRFFVPSNRRTRDMPKSKRKVDPEIRSQPGRDMTATSLPVVVVLIAVWHALCKERDRRCAASMQAS